jgi:hypothetical protein
VFGVRQSATQSAVLYGPFYGVDANGAWKLITQLVLDATFGSPPELRLHIAILPNYKGDRIGGAAYVKSDPTKSISKVFRLHPGKQSIFRGRNEEPLCLDYDDDFIYMCVYYGTENDQPIEALKDGPKKIPDLVPWKSSASLETEIDTLKKEVEGLRGKATESENEIKRLNGVVTASGNEIKGLNGRVAESKRENDRLRAVVKAVEGAIEDLKNDDKNKASNADNDPSNADKKENSKTDGEKKPSE